MDLNLGSQHGGMVAWGRAERHGKKCLERVIDPREGHKAEHKVGKAVGR